MTNDTYLKINTHLYIYSGENVEISHKSESSRILQNRIFLKPHLITPKLHTKPEAVLNYLFQETSFFYEKSMIFYFYRLRN